MKHEIMISCILGLLLLTVAAKADCSLNSTKDTFVDSSHPNDNFGTNMGLMIQNTSTAKETTYLEFDLTGVTAALPLTAEVCLNKYGGSFTNIASDNITMGSYHVLSPFDEATLTWNNQPCGTSWDNSTNCNPVASDVNKTLWLGSYPEFCWDVTDFVTDSLMGTKVLDIAIFPSGSEGAGLAFDMFSSNYVAAFPAPTYPYLHISTASCSVAATTTTAEPYSPEANYDMISGGLTYIGASLGLQGANALVGGKFIIWVIIEIAAVVGIAIVLSNYGVHLNVTIISILLLVLLGLGVIVGFVPLWIGAVLLVLAAALIVKTVIGLSGGA